MNTPFFRRRTIVIFCRSSVPSSTTWSTNALKTFTMTSTFNVWLSCRDDCCGQSTINCSFSSSDNWKRRIDRWIWYKSDVWHERSRLSPMPFISKPQMIRRMANVNWSHERFNSVCYRCLSICWVRILSQSTLWLTVARRRRTRRSTSNVNKLSLLTVTCASIAMKLIVVFSSNFIEQHISPRRIHLLRSRLYTIRDQARDWLCKCTTILDKRYVRFIVEELIAGLQRSYNIPNRRNRISMALMFTESSHSSLN